MSELRRTIRLALQYLNSGLRREEEGQCSFANPTYFYCVNKDEQEVVKLLGGLGKIRHDQTVVDDTGTIFVLEIPDKNNVQEVVKKFGNDVEETQNS